MRVKKILVSYILGLLCFNTNFVLAKEAMNDYFNHEQIVEWEKQMEEKFSLEEIEADVKNMDRSAMGSWSWRDGVICVSSSSTSGFNHGHAGIVATAPYYDSTVEANPNTGVKVIHGDWNVRMKNEKIWQLGVTRTTVKQDHLAAKWAEKQMGKKYNDDFLDIWRRDRFYCSHLVWAAYKDTANVDIGTWAWGPMIHPYELIDSSETTIIFRNH